MVMDGIHAVLLAAAVGGNRPGLALDVPLEEARRELRGTVVRSGEILLAERDLALRSARADRARAFCLRGHPASGSCQTAWGTDSPRGLPRTGHTGGHADSGQAVQLGSVTPSALLPETLPLSRGVRPGSGGMQVQGQVAEVLDPVEGHQIAVVLVPGVR